MHSSIQSSRQSNDKYCLILCSTQYRTYAKNDGLSIPTFFCNWTAAIRPKIGMVKKEKSKIIPGVNVQIVNKKC